ncbi:MAG: S8 family serine peptidase [Patescibacteria group bacterium]|nr:S8 family serine peptidase [Patescibacteria group bacterium]
MTRGEKEKMKKIIMIVVMLSLSITLSAKERILVKGRSEEELQQILQQIGITETKEVIPGWRLVLGDETSEKKLREKGLYTEPDYIMYIYSAEYDSLFPFQWGLTANGGMWQGDFREAWQITRGTRDLKIGLIDTGSPLKEGKWTHPDLDSSRFRIGPNFVGMGEKGDWYSPDSLDLTPTDYNGHATHLAGIIGASHNGRGIEGIDTAATIAVYKAFTKEGWGYYSWIANAIYRAVHDSCKVLNMSFGGDSIPAS